MKVYADYTFYKEQGGTMEEADFNRAALKASAYLRGVTLGRADEHAGDELKYATCEIADLYDSMFSVNRQRDGVSSSGEVKSVSNDGYSVTFVSEASEGETKETLYAKKAYAIARTWLLGTGLLSRKVGCCHGGGCCD